MAQLSLIKDSSIIFGGMFGQVTSHPERPGDLLFLADPAVQACSQSLVSIDQWMEVDSGDVLTVEVSDDALVALKANMIETLRNRWTRGYERQMSTTANRYTKQMLALERDIVNRGTDTFLQSCLEQGLIQQKKVNLTLTNCHFDCDYEYDDGVAQWTLEDMGTVNVSDKGELFADDDHAFESDASGEPGSFGDFNAPATLLMYVPTNATKDIIKEILGVLSAGPQSEFFRNTENLSVDYASRVAYDEFEGEDEGELEDQDQSETFEPNTPELDATVFDNVETTSQGEPNDISDEHAQQDHASNEPEADEVPAAPAPRPRFKFG